MIPLLGAVEATRLRYGASETAGVRPEPGSSTFRATFVPSGARLPNVAPEDVFDFVSYTELRPFKDGEHYADWVEVDGVTYEVAVAVPHPAFLGQPAHWVGVVVRVETVPEEEEP